MGKRFRLWKLPRAKRQISCSEDGKSGQKKGWFSEMIDIKILTAIAILLGSLIAGSVSPNAGPIPVPKPNVETGSNAGK